MFRKKIIAIILIIIGGLLISGSLLPFKKTQAVNPTPTLTVYPPGCNQYPCDPTDDSTCCPDQFMEPGYTLHWTCTHLPDVIPTPMCLVDSCQTLALRIQNTFRSQCIDPADEQYNPIADIDKNGIINALDAKLLRANANEQTCRTYSLASHYPTTCESPSPTTTIVPTAITPSPTTDPDITLVYISPDRIDAEPQSTVSADIMIDNVTNLAAYEFKLNYSPDVIEINDIQEGGFLETTGRTLQVLEPQIDNAAGEASFGAFTLGSTPLGPNGSGKLATITFTTKNSGSTILDLNSVQATDPSANLLTITIGKDIVINIVSPQTPTPSPYIQRSTLQFRYCKTPGLTCQQDSECCSELGCHPGNNKCRPYPTLTPTPTPKPVPTFRTSSITIRYCAANNSTCNTGSDCCSDTCDQTTSTCKPRTDASPTPTFTPTPTPTTPPQGEKSRDICSSGAYGEPPGPPDGKIDTADISCLIAPPYPVTSSKYNEDRDSKRDLCSPGGYQQPPGPPDKIVDTADISCLIAPPFPSTTEH